MTQATVVSKYCFSSWWLKATIVTIYIYPTIKNVYKMPYIHVVSQQFSMVEEREKPHKILLTTFLKHHQINVVLVSLDHHQCIGLQNNPSNIFTVSETMQPKSARTIPFTGNEFVCEKVSIAVHDKNFLCFLAKSSVYLLFLGKFLNTINI